MAVRVYIVDDHALIRAGLVRLIDLEEDLEVVGEGVGSSQTLTDIRRLQPNVIVVDLEMPEVRGVDLIEQIKFVNPEAHVLVCSMHSTYAYVSESLRAGAQGYVLKSSPSSCLVEGIRRVAAGQAHIDPGLQSEVLRLLQSPEGRLFDKELTTQETETLKLASQGLSNQEIAGRTGQSVETVKLRLRRTFQKLGAADRASAVAAAMRRNLIQ